MKIISKNSEVICHIIYFNADDDECSSVDNGGFSQTYTNTNGASLVHVTVVFTR